MSLRLAGCKGDGVPGWVAPVGGGEAQGGGVWWWQ